MIGSEIQLFCLLECQREQWSLTKREGTASYFSPNPTELSGSLDSTIPLAGPDCEARPCKKGRPWAFLRHRCPISCEPVTKAHWSNVWELSIEIGRGRKVITPFCRCN